MPPTAITILQELPLAPQVLVVSYHFRVTDGEAVLVNMYHSDPAHGLARAHYLQHEAALRAEAVKASHYSTPVPPPVIPTPDQCP